MFITIIKFNKRIVKMDKKKFKLTKNTSKGQKKQFQVRKKFSVNELKIVQKNNY